MAHAVSPVPPIRARRPDVPEALAAVLARLLAKEPAGRFADARAAADALAPFAAGAVLWDESKPAAGPCRRGEVFARHRSELSPGPQAAGIPT